MCEAVNLEVVRLKRVAIDTLKLGMLQQGKWRELTEQEVKRLIITATKTEFNQDQGDANRGKRKTRTK